MLNVGDLISMLAGDDVKLQSGNQAKDIDVDAALSWTSTSRLTFDSYRAIAFNKPVVVAGSGAMTIMTNDGGSGGDFQFFKKGRIEFWDLDSDLIINTNRYALANSVSQIRKLIHGGQHGEHFIALAKKIDAMRYQGGTMPVAPDILEGLGNTISNLKIADGTDNGNVGLFESAATVRNLGLLKVDILGFGSEQRVGAIAGIIGGSIINCYVTGEVSATGTDSNAGGLAGANNGAIVQSWVDTSVSAGPSATAAGGLAGVNEGTVDKSYSVGVVTSGDNVVTGGLIGYNFGGTISNSYGSASVVGGNNGFVGGLTGANSNGKSSSPTISMSYSIGAVSGGTGSSIGGLIGEDLAQTGTANTYWDLDTSGISDPSKGAGNVANDSGIIGLTAEQFKSGLPQGFEKKVWKEKAPLNNGYPYLIGNPPPD